jgi:Type IV secretion system proteins
MAMLALAPQAHAVLGVGDTVVCTNCTDEVTTVANDVLIAAQWVTQLERMTEQIIQQINIFHSLSGLTNVNGMAAILNQAGNFNQMGSFGNVPGLLQGAGGGVGAVFQAANGNALPVGSVMPLMATTAAVFNARAGSVATVQGISGQLLNNSNVILAGLMALQQLIDHQPTSQLMGGMQSRLNTYQGNINSQQYQLSQMQSFANAQDKAFDQRMQMANYCAAQAWATSTQPLTGAGLNLGAAHCPVGAAPVIAAGGGGGFVNGALPAAAVGGGTGTAIIGAGGVVSGFTDTGSFDTEPAPVTPAGNGGLVVPAGTTDTTGLPVPPVPPAAAPVQQATGPDLTNVVGGDGQEINVNGPPSFNPGVTEDGVPDD